MLVKIIVGRSRLPEVGQVIEYNDIYAQSLIDNGLAEKADKKQTKKVVKKPPTRGETDGEESEKV